MGASRKNEGVVYKIEPGMDVTQVEATTYQMRNFYKQLADGFFSSLDIFNYIQHHFIVKHICRKGSRVLDVCCGRGLLLPLLRYHQAEIAEYVGLDIEPKNMPHLDKRVTDGKPVPDDYYPFKISLYPGNAARMASVLPGKFDIIIYTSSIEHMQKSDGEKSVEQCALLSKKGTLLVLTCPNTSEDKSGYDTQYAAHVYEWKRSELEGVLSANGFKIKREWGLLANKRLLEQEYDKLGFKYLFDLICDIVPSEWAVPVLAIPFPRVSKEIGIIAEKV